jgi:putative endonuclease
MSFFIEKVYGDRGRRIVKKWYIYILECSDGRLYTGMTNDVERRFQEHVSGKGGHFTRAFGVSKLLYKEGHPTRKEASNREMQIKGWTKRKKLALLNGNIALLKIL